MAFDKVSRRAWMTQAPLLGAAAAQTGGATKPNIIVIISDQFRGDCIGALGLNPMGLTPNLDRMAAEGVLSRSAFCNQPVCAPARASMFTGQYPSKHGVWRNSFGLSPDAVTLAGTLNRAGYSSNYIGKWHLMAAAGRTGQEVRGWVPPQFRGGFNGRWEASNELEFTTHAYEGEMYDNEGKPIAFSEQYRTEFMTDRAKRFLRSAKGPFFLTISYLEVHHQNDKDTFDPPKDFKDRYPNPFIPPDLRPLPGSWPSQLSDYFACVAKMDETVGEIRKTLRETGLDKNTIVVFLSDHGCHFKTRNTEYKRSPHDSSIHIPLVICGPGFNRSMQISELVSQVDLMPTLLEAAGVAIPASVQGRSFLPLLDRTTGNWRNEVYFEMTEFVTGRGLRTPQYTYAAAAPKTPGWKAVPSADRYVEYIHYDIYADPFQHVNLAGRATHKISAEQLRARLLARIREASGATPAIDAAWFPYP
jgi:arylsulfatase A-like enzyme